MTLVKSLSEFEGTGRLVARPIGAGNVRQAHLLAQLNWLKLSFVDWVHAVARAGQNTLEQKGWLAIEDRRRCVYAICFLEARPSMEGGRVLRVSDIVSVEFPAGETMLAIGDCLSYLARQYNISALQVEFGAGASQQQVAQLQAHFSEIGWAAKTRISMQAHVQWN